MLPNIKYNKVVDFVFSIQRLNNLQKCCYDKQFTKKFTLNEDVSRYLQHVGKNINSILKRDLNYFFCDFYQGIFAITTEVLNREINSIPSFIDYLNQVSSKEFLDMIIRELEINIPNNVSEEEMEEIFKNEVSKMESPDHLEVYMDFLKYTEDMKVRLVKTVTDYYYNFFCSIEDKMQSFIETKINAHKELLAMDKNKFYDNMLYLIDKQLINDENSHCTFYISYFDEIGSLIIVPSTKMDYVVIYGYGLEQKYNDNVKKEEYKELIKVLADDKRLSIVQALGERSWYSKELADHFNIPTPTMSYHIKKINSLGIIHLETGKNRRIYYKLNKEKFLEILEYMAKDITKS